MGVDDIFPRMKTRQTLRAGTLAVEVTLGPSGLQSVTLPAEVPDGLDAAMLASLVAQLAEFPLDLDEAPPFTRSVWKRMQRIPAGQALTYGELATAVGSPRAARAVGQACATNPRLLIVPCHRVVASEGLGGFAYGLDWKRKLLELEAHE